MWSWYKFFHLIPMMNIMNSKVCLKWINFHEERLLQKTPFVLTSNCLISAVTA